jgi:hypothetical protein
LTDGDVCPRSSEVDANSKNKTANSLAISSPLHGVNQLLKSLAVRLRENQLLCYIGSSTDFRNTFSSYPAYLPVALGSSNEEVAGFAAGIHA